MSIQLASNFQENAALPLDARTVVANNTVRDAIPAGQRYDGLAVYNIANNITYQLQGGITNGDWVATGAGNIDLVTALFNTAPGAIALAPINSSGFDIAIPFDNTDATTHTIGLGIKANATYYPFFQIVGKGNGGGTLDFPAEMNLNFTTNLVSPIGQTTNLNLKDLSFSTPFTAIFSTTQYGFLTEVNSGTGGIFFVGASSGDNIGMIIGGLNGSTTPTNGATYILGAKWNGATAFAPIGASELFMGFGSAPIGGPTIFSIYGNGDFTPTGLQSTVGATSAAASTLTLPRQARVNISAGTGTINNISNTGYQDFDEIEIMFTGNVIVNSSAGGSGQIRLEGNLTESFKKYDVLALRYYQADDIFIQSYLSVNN